MSTFKDVWDNLAKNKKYREAFAISIFKRMVPFQVRALRKQRHWSQEDLAKSANLTQGVISRAEDPDYGNLTVNTISRIAAGFDVAFIVKFVPFSELDMWFLGLTEKSAQVPTFEEESDSLAFSAIGNEEAVDDRVSRLVKATITKKQSEEEVIDIESRRQNMEDILSPKSTFGNRRPEVEVTLCR